MTTFGVSKQSQKQQGEFRYLQQIFSSVLPDFSNIKCKLKIRLKCYRKKINRQFPLMAQLWLLNVTIWVTTSTESNKSLKPVESKGSTDHLSLLSDCCSWKVMPGHHLYIQPGSAVSLGHKSSANRASGMNLLVYSLAVQELHDRHSHGTQTLHVPLTLCCSSLNIE